MTRHFILDLPLNKYQLFSVDFDNLIVTLCPKHELQNGITIPIDRHHEKPT